MNNFLFLNSSLQCLSIENPLPISLNVDSTITISTSLTKPLQKGFFSRLTSSGFPFPPPPSLSLTGTLTINSIKKLIQSRFLTSRLQLFITSPFQLQRPLTSSLNLLSSFSYRSVGALLLSGALQLTSVRNVVQQTKKFLFSTSQTSSTFSRQLQRTFFTLHSLGSVSSRTVFRPLSGNLQITSLNPLVKQLQKFLTPSLQTVSTRLLQLQRSLFSRSTLSSSYSGPQSLIRRPTPKLMIASSLFLHRINLICSLLITQVLRTSIIEKIFLYLLSATKALFLKMLKQASA